MTYRVRLSIVATLAVACASLIACIAVFLSFKSSLYAQVDEALQGNARLTIGMARRSDVLPAPRTPPGGAVSILQVVGSDGTIKEDRVSAMSFGPGSGRAGSRPPRSRPFQPTDDSDQEPPSPELERLLRSAREQQTQSLTLDITDQTREILVGKANNLFEDQEINSVHLRVFSTRLPNGEVAQLARSVEEIDSSLADARRILFLIAAGAIGIAALLGWYLTRLASTPVQRLERLATDVAQQQDLSLRITEIGSDEIGRLATRFNEMLDALAEARRLQQQLVEDASHELRTPLTSMKTNIEVLALSNELSGEQHAILHDINVQIDELSELAANLVELAHGHAPSGERERIDLADVLSEAIAKAERFAAGRVSITSDIGSCHATIDRDRVQSAVDNLMSNAVKWTPDDGTVRVTLDQGTIEVCDEGPGVAEEDRPYVFDRFYRSVAARGKPGAGLGLAITKSAAEERGGSVSVTDGPDGVGACFVLQLPVE